MTIQAEVNLTVNREDNAFMARSKRTLLNNFRLTSGNKLHSAALLANYLVALEREDEALNFINSYIYRIQYDDDMDMGVWDHSNQARVLAAYIARKKDNPKNISELVEQIVQDEIESVGDGNSEPLSESLSYDYEEALYWQEHLLDESHKYRCEILSQQALSFIYYLFAWPVLKHQVDSSELENIERIIGDTFRRLKIEIEGPRKAANK